jgi:hypothetical protein
MSRKAKKGVEEEPKKKKKITPEESLNRKLKHLEEKKAKLVVNDFVPPKPAWCIWPIWDSPEMATIYYSHYGYHGDTNEPNGELLFTYHTNIELRKCVYSPVEAIQKESLGILQKLHKDDKRTELCGKM